ncbi:MAG: ArsR family transcriptional regulator [Archaeoglobaceae archaeon]
MTPIEFSDRKKEETREILKLISKRGVSSILRILRENPRRFSQIMFETKLNPSILDRHLKALIKAGLVVKDGENYRLTDYGDYILKVLEDFFKSLDS